MNGVIVEEMRVVRIDECYSSEYNEIDNEFGHVEECRRNMLLSTFARSLICRFALRWREPAKTLYVIQNFV
ncbi:hypothetical protein LT85_4922 [Collimonas arenae]|uniref:Uncharacterized protein n=1 Tax=Collimonas arenae TaxID=279058 RepID=A0A0A1FK18_9BURK|nr:hypothetical protein [Collimonas arenae]AIY44080.1 hypothetical protein LT85_4922 [Collimonas arenae]